MTPKTLRGQLTLLYAGPFFVFGALLMTVPLLGAEHTQPVGGSPSAAHPVTTQVGVSHFPVLLWAICLAVLLVAAAALGWLVSGRVLRPLRAITATARDISASDLHRRLGGPGGTGEFAELAATLDGLFERLEKAFASQRHFVANASHELRTPLTAQRALLQVALADPGVTVESLSQACRQVLVLEEGQERLIEALLTLADSQHGLDTREPLDLAEIAQEVLAEGPAGVPVDADLRPAPMVGDHRLVRVLVANLVDNACRHNVPGGRVEIRTGAGRIEVGNTGPVVPPDDVERLLKPFQRLDGRRSPARRGPAARETHGLGLAIVAAVADAHGADLRASARPTGGLDVVVTFR